MKHNIKIKNISFSDDFNDVTGLLSYWVSGTLSFKDEEYVTFKIYHNRIIY